MQLIAELSLLHYYIFLEIENITKNLQKKKNYVRSLKTLITYHCCFIALNGN